MNHVGLFEGIGGFSLAARWMGWETKAWCEINPFGQHVLRHYFPEAEGFDDVTKSNFSKYENTIDILTGGFPCQPYSVAGKRLGNEDDRHLWPYMLKAIQQIKPRWIVGENVLGLVDWSDGMVFDEVQSDLETAFKNSETTRSLEREGYEVLPVVLPAAGVNAPHRRYRVWFIAYSSSNGQQRGSDRGELRGKRSRGDERPPDVGCIPGADWENFPTQSPVCSGNDGIPSGLDLGSLSATQWKNESIKAGGNAIVPQVALQIFKAIKEYDKLLHTDSICQQLSSH